MKSSVLTAISLTLLMFLLVLVAGFVFVFQNQVQLQQQLQNAQQEFGTLQQRQAQTEIDLSAAWATQTPAAAAFATAQAESFALDQQLVSSEQTKQALDSEIGDLMSNIEELMVDLETIKATVNRYEAQGPLINVISPVDQAAVSVGQTVSITIAASDINDVIEVMVHVGDELLDTEPITKGPIVTIDANWVASGNGLVVMRVTAVNANGINSDFTVPLNVIAPTSIPTATPTPTATTTTPVATSTS